LAEILVGRHHINTETLLFGTLCQGTDDVVGFEAIHFEYGDVKASYDLLDLWRSITNILRGLLPRGFVFFKELIAEGWRGGIESHGNVCGLLLLKYFQECVREPEGHRRVVTLGIDARTFGEREVGSIDQGICVKQKQRLL